MQIVSLSLVATLLAYSLMSALTPFFATSASAGGGYDPNAPTVNEQSAVDGATDGDDDANGNGGQNGDDANGETNGENTNGGGDGNNNENGEEAADGEATANTCASFGGLCWYWWLPIAAVVAGAVALVVRNRREEA